MYAIRSYYAVCIRKIQFTRNVRPLKGLIPGPVDVFSDNITQIEYDWCGQGLGTGCAGELFHNFNSLIRPVQGHITAVYQYLIRSLFFKRILQIGNSRQTGTKGSIEIIV